VRSDGRLIIVKTTDTQCFTKYHGRCLAKIICQPIAGLRRENDERKLTGQTNGRKKEIKEGRRHACAPPVIISLF
jgi:hypothetical protein